MATELQRRIPGWRFVETPDVDAGVVPVAVVFVTSAVAPVTESDCALAHLVTAEIDAVVAVVSKVDDHRDWRAVLAANRERLASRAPRYRRIPWVGAAAAPRLGEPIVEGLVEHLQRDLDDPSLDRRNSLRAREFRVQSAMSRLEAEAVGADHRSRADALRGTRDRLLRQERLSMSDGTVALRRGIQQARVAVTYSARTQCVTVRTELQNEVAASGRRRFGDIEQCVRRRCADLLSDVDEEITAHIRDVAVAVGLDELPRPFPARPIAVADPPLKSRRLETQLMTVLGAGFGLGVALLVSRLFAGMAPDVAAGGPMAGGVIGLALTVWVVRSRGLLHDRAVLDRWVAEVTGAVRAAAEERVATTVLAAEAALASAHLARNEAARLQKRRRIAEIDAELREHGCEIARAEAAREREMPALQRALDAIHNALTSGNSTESAATDR